MSKEKWNVGDEIFYGDCAGAVTGIGLTGKDAGKVQISYRNLASKSRSETVEPKAIKMRETKKQK